MNTAASTIGSLPAKQAYELALSQWTDGAFDFDEAEKAGLNWRPFAPENRSPIVSVPVNDPEGVMGRLRAANVVASLRAGAVRLSVHFYNLEAEIDRVVELIADHQ